MSTKYEISDEYWNRANEVMCEKEPPTTVKSHTVAVIMTVDENAEMGYGREKYSVQINHSTSDAPVALYAMQYRWKGNYWQKQRQIDWCDVPVSVKRETEQVVECNGINDLDPGHRLIGEGGRDPWRQEDTDE
jgi:hypothetical protein